MVRDSVTSCAALHKSVSTGLRKYLYVFHDKDCDKFPKCESGLVGTRAGSEMM